MTVVAAAVDVPAEAAIVEVQVVRMAAAVVIQRTRQVVAVGSSKAELRAGAVARSGKEDTVAVRAGNPVTVNTVK